MLKEMERQSLQELREDHRRLVSLIDTCIKYKVKLEWRIERLEEASVAPSVNLKRIEQILSPDAGENPS